MYLAHDLDPLRSDIMSPLRQHADFLVLSVFQHVHTEQLAGKNI